MPASVRSCREAGDVRSFRLGEERRLSTGSTRRYVTCERGRPLLVQLPACYTPGGLLSDFDEGARIDLVPLGGDGRADMALFRDLLDRVCERGSVKGRPSLDSDTGEIRASTARARDVRVFEAEDLAADDCPVLPGDTLTAIVSPDYVWRSASGDRAGLCVRLVQLLIHTDRGRYRHCLPAGPRAPQQAPQAPPPPPPRPGARPDAPPPPPKPPRCSGPAKARQGQEDGRFRPTVMQIVTARNALRKVSGHTGGI